MTTDSGGRIIILEGLDLTGKTTCANAIVEHYGKRTALLHAGPPLTDVPTIEYCVPFRLAATGWTVVCDRWHLGELVWAPLFDRQPIFSPQQLPLLEKRMREYHAPIECFYLQRDMTDLQSALFQTDEPVYALGHALNAYETAMLGSTFEWHRRSMPELLRELSSWS